MLAAHPVGWLPRTAPDALVRLSIDPTKPEQGLGPRARAPALPFCDIDHVVVGDAIDQIVIRVDPGKRH